VLYRCDTPTLSTRTTLAHGSAMSPRRPNARDTGGSNDLVAELLQHPNKVGRPGAVQPGHGLTHDPPEEPHNTNHPPFVQCHPGTPFLQEHVEGPGRMHRAKIAHKRSRSRVQTVVSSSPHTANRSTMPGEDMLDQVSGGMNFGLMNALRTGNILFVSRSPSLPSLPRWARMCCGCMLRAHSTRAVCSARRAATAR
jgi:hypothetical protein